MKSLLFNSLLVALPVGLIFLLIRALPDRDPVASVRVELSVQPVELAPIEGPLRLAGAWTLEAGDRRFGGLSALAVDKGKLLAISDRGALIRFSLPDAPQHLAEISDLRIGPGPFGKKWGRDAESLARDPHGRGWWVGFEQRHSLWLYDNDFSHAQAAVRLDGLGWRDNHGAEGLVVRDGKLVALGEDGSDAVRTDGKAITRLPLEAPAEVADAARAPDGSSWVLLRQEGARGISQAIAPLETTQDGYRVGPGWALPTGPFDNMEGMAIMPRADGGWRFWLISDDGHRVMARTLLVALDLDLSSRHDKSPATSTGPSKKPSVETP